MTEVLQTEPLSAVDAERLDAYWRAADYLSVGQIYLMANPLLHDPLAAEHVKPRLLGHFGTTPGENRAFVRAAVAERVSHLDADVHVVHAREELVAARAVREVVQWNPA